MVGRTVSLDRGQAAGRPRARRCSRSPGLVVDDDRRHPRGRRRRPDRARRRGARHRRRAGQRADRAGRGDHGPAPGARRHGRPWTATGPARLDAPRRCSAPGSATSPRTAASTAWSRSSASPRTWSSTSTTGRRSATRLRAATRTRSPRRPGSGSSSSTSVPRRPTRPVGTLSGGNQQKVIVARELSRPLKLFIAAQPTRGVDVGSIEFIHSRIIARARRRHRRAGGLQRAGRGGRRWPTGSR